MTHGLITKHRLSFGYVHVYSDAIAEILVDNGIIISLEMVEEFDRFIERSFQGNYCLLVNKVNDYHLSFEAKLCFGSSPQLNGIAIVVYNEKAKQSIEHIAQTRKTDELIIKSFNAYTMGRQQAITWLQSLLN